jgi:hypothetical protein
MKNLILYLGAVILIVSCDRIFEVGGEEVLDDIDLKTEPKLVVEAMVTELDTFQVVKLSTTKGMYAINENRMVNNATVQVKGGGETYEFEYIDSLEHYMAKFKGMPSMEYTLEITWNGKKYTARETMADLQQFDIDSIEIRKARYDFYHWRYLDPDAPFRQFKGQEILITIDQQYTTKDTLIGGEIFEHHAVYVNPQKKDEVLVPYKYGDLAEFWFGGEPYVIEAAREDRIMNVYKVYLHTFESQVESNFYRFDIKGKASHGYTQDSSLLPMILQSVPISGGSNSRDFLLKAMRWSS